MHLNVSVPIHHPAQLLTPSACSALLQAPPGAFQSTPRTLSASQPCLAPMDAPSSPKSGPQVRSTNLWPVSIPASGSLLTTATQANAPSCAYLEIHDDYDDNDELPPIPEEWATPIIATHCQPVQPQSAAVCAPASVRCTEDDTRDYKWLTDIFAVRIHLFHNLPPPNLFS